MRRERAPRDEYWPTRHGRSPLIVCVLPPAPEFRCAKVASACVPPASRRTRRGFLIRNPLHIRRSARGTGIALFKERR